MITILLIYTYIVRYVRQTNPRQQKTIDRDILVITAIVLLTVSIPLTYHIQGLSMFIGLLITTICFVFIAPQIRLRSTDFSVFIRKRYLRITRNRNSQLISDMFLDLHYERKTD